LQAIAMNEGVRLRQALWNTSGRAKLKSLQLTPWATCRRQDLPEVLDRLTPKIAPLSLAIEREALKRPEVRLSMTHPGVGPITALAFVLIIARATGEWCAH
jgi:transposase